MATTRAAATSNGDSRGLQVYQGDQAQKYLQDQLQKFSKYTTENAIIIAPQVDGLVVPANHVPSVAVVQASWSEQGDRLVSDDIYPQGTGKFALLKHMIERIAEAAGVKWDPDRCKVTRYPNRDVLYEAVGTMQSINGEIYTVHGSKLIERQTDLDEVTLAAEKRYQYAPDKNPKPGSEKFEFRVRQDMLEKDKHRVRMAESKAKLAALRERLNLKATYTLAELRKPFVIPRLTFMPDYDDPEVRKMASAQALGLSREIYGHEADIRQLPAPEEPPDSGGMTRPHLIEPDQETPHEPALDRQPEPAAADVAPAPTSIASPPAAAAGPTAGPASVALSAKSEQLVERIRKAAERANQKDGEISGPQLALLQKQLVKGRDRVVSEIWPNAANLEDLTRRQASALIDECLGNRDEIKALAEELAAQKQEGLPLA